MTFCFPLERVLKLLNATEFISSGVDTAKLVNPKPRSRSQTDLGIRTLEMGEDYNVLARENRQFIIRKHCCCFFKLEFVYF